MVAIIFACEPSFLARLHCCSSTGFGNKHIGLPVDARLEEPNTAVPKCAIGIMYSLVIGSNGGEFRH